MRFAVVVFPGTWSDHDTHHSLTAVLGQEADLVWHRERDLSQYDVVVLANVLEHAWDPLQMLAEVRPLLRPQGGVWISCSGGVCCGAGWLLLHGSESDQGDKE